MKKTPSTAVWSVLVGRDEACVVAFAESVELVAGEDGGGGGDVERGGGGL